MGKSGHRHRKKSAHLKPQTLSTLRGRGSLKARAERLQHESTVLAHRHTPPCSRALCSARRTRSRESRETRAQSWQAAAARGADAAREAIERTTNSHGWRAHCVASRARPRRTRRQRSKSAARACEAPLERLGGSSGGGVERPMGARSRRLLRPRPTTGALRRALQTQRHSAGAALPKPLVSGISMSIGSSSSEEELAAVLGAPHSSLSTSHAYSHWRCAIIRPGGSRPTAGCISPQSQWRLSGSIALLLAHAEASTMPVLSKALTAPHRWW